MEARIYDGPQPKSKKEQNQVVNEQDQQEKVNPGGEDFQSNAGKNPENPDNSFSIKNQPGLEEGNTYEDDPKRGENKMPVN